MAGLVVRPIAHRQAWAISGKLGSHKCQPVMEHVEFGRRGVRQGTLRGRLRLLLSFNRWRISACLAVRLRNTILSPALCGLWASFASEPGPSAGRPEGPSCP